MWKHFQYRYKCVLSFITPYWKCDTVMRHHRYRPADKCAILPIGRRVWNAASQTTRNITNTDRTHCISSIITGFITQYVTMTTHHMTSQTLIEYTVSHPSQASSAWSAATAGNLLRITTLDPSADPVCRKCNSAPRAPSNTGSSTA